jgi:hypothetical protein
MGFLFLNLLILVQICDIDDFHLLEICFFMNPILCIYFFIIRFINREAYVV